MSRSMRITLAVLLLAVAFGVIYFRGLQQRILELARPELAERRAVRELSKTASSADDAKVKAKMFWLSAEQHGQLEAEETALSLSPSPTTRAKQLIEALIANPPSPAQRTLPADAVLIEFYLLDDGTGVADFSGALASQMPSGILSEDCAVESIVKTMEANVPQVLRLKILIQGAEVDTLAGHLDLTGFFQVRSATPPAAAPPPKSDKKVSNAPTRELTRNDVGQRFGH